MSILHHMSPQSSPKRKKWTCPLQKRTLVNLDLAKQSKTIVIYPHYTFRLRNDYLCNHERFEWLHKNVLRPWVVGCPGNVLNAGEPFCYPIVFMFDNEDDAVGFAMSSPEKCLIRENYAERVRREAALSTFRSQMFRMSAEERIERFPGYDEFILANFVGDKAAA